MVYYEIANGGFHQRFPSKSRMRNQGSLSRFSILPNPLVSRSTTSGGSKFNLRLAMPLPPPIECLSGGFLSAHSTSAIYTTKKKYIYSRAKKKIETIDKMKNLCAFNFYQIVYSILFYRNLLPL